MMAAPETDTAQTLGITRETGLAEGTMQAEASTQEEDHVQMLRVRDGETQLLGVLFEKHHRPLYGFFVRITGQRTLSEDLVQQVFYRILKYKHSYRDEGCFRTWMYHLARRVAADHFQKNARSPLAGAEPEVLETLADAAPHAAKQTELQDNLALMRKALGMLTPTEKELLTLHRFQHLSHEELAQLHGCSVGAMKVRVHRALETLRKTFFRLNKPTLGGTLT